VKLAEIAFGICLVAILLALAGYYGWRQRGVARGLKAVDDADTRLYLRRQIRRRLICSALLVVLAGMLVGWWFLEARMRSNIADASPPTTSPKSAEPPQVFAARQLAAEVFVYYWGLFLVLLSGVFVLATLDMVANARFGFRQQRKIDVARELMMAQEAARLRPGDMR